MLSPFTLFRQQCHMTIPHFHVAMYCFPATTFRLLETTNGPAYECLVGVQRVHVNLFRHRYFVKTSKPDTFEL